MIKEDNTNKDHMNIVANLMDVTGCGNAVVSFLKLFGELVDDGYKFASITTVLDEKKNKIGVALFYVGDAASVEQRVKKPLVEST